MLVDDITIRIRAGNGGKGAVAFNKIMMALGPAGGSGGLGGSVYAEGISDLSGLGQFRFKKEFAAEDGRDGRDGFRDGHNGKDLVLKVPVGTVAHNLTTGEDITIAHIGERVPLAKGGKGGKGNFLFRSAKHTSPTRFQPGLPGESFSFRLELKMIADVGFVGLPNAGKSSMLNRLTNANTKVANYPFTTLEPNLGVYYELILADIPGLIEGSSAGKGLGIKFLRHIERTRILFHFVSAESPDPAADYKTIRKELGLYNKELAEKPEYVFLTKTDLVSPVELKKKLAALKKACSSAKRTPKNKASKKAAPRSKPKPSKSDPIAISIQDPESIKNIQRILNGIQAEK